MRVSGRIGWVLVLCVAGAVAWGQATRPADPDAAMQAIRDDIAKLEASSPTFAKLKALNDKANAITAELESKRRPVYEAIYELQREEAWMEFAAKRDTLYRELQAINQQKLALLQADAKALYEARHAELKRRSAGGLPEGRKLGFNVLNYPQVDGSTSTHPLTVILASRLLDVQYQWHYPEPSGYFWGAPSTEVPLDHFLPGSEPGRIMVDAANLNAPADTAFILAASRITAVPGDAPASVRTARLINSMLAANTNTHASFMNLINGKTDLILTARGPSASELEAAAKKGVKIATTPIARDALVFIVNRHNPIEGITLDQARDIYREKITKWSQIDPKLAGHTVQVGDQKQPFPDAIAPLRRERDSGSRELFDALVMEGEELEEQPRDSWRRRVFAYSMVGPYNRVTQEQGALAYSVHYYERFMAMSPYTRSIAIDGVKPTEETIAAKKYPLTSDVMVAYREGAPADSPAMKLLRYLQSEEGQALIRESGYVSVSK